MSKLAIRTDGLSKRYRLGGLDRYDTIREAITRLIRRPVGNGQADRHLWALRDVDIEIAAGEAVGLIGPNGAGKTTLLRVLTRITEPTSGTAYVTGRVGSLLEVGTGFHPELTGRENVFLNGAILGMRRREVVTKLDEIVEFAGVERFVDTPVKRYSSGMQVRLAFAVAAHLETEILLVDEVLAVGDAEFQRRGLGKMEGLAGSGRTVILVSHNMANITRLCPRAIFLRAGEVVEDGPAVDVVARYLSGEYGTSARREWQDEDAPGDDLVRLRGVRIVAADGESVDGVDVREQVGIEVSFDVLSRGEEFVPWIALYDETGAHVFSAMDIHPRWREPSPPGSYEVTAWIPPNLLNEGSVFVSVSLLSFSSGGKATRHAFADGAISFNVYDPGEGDTARGHFVGPWRAPVRPLLEWTTREA
jgi:lipopolysaccharide transport system ATP-binding protein